MEKSATRTLFRPLEIRIRRRTGSTEVEGIVGFGSKPSIPLQLRVHGIALPGGIVAQANRCGGGGVEAEIREDFRPVEKFLQRALVYSHQLREFNHNDWVHLRNREDFHQIYNLPDSQRYPLERIYQDGRDLASQLSHLLCEFNSVGEYPTFKSFVDAVREYVSSEPLKLKEALVEAETVLPGVPQPPWAIDQMIRLSREQLNMVAALVEWIRLAHDTPLYRQEAGLPAIDLQPLRVRAISFLKRHGGQLIVGLVGTVAGGLILKAILG